MCIEYEYEVENLFSRMEKESLKRIYSFEFLNSRCMTLESPGTYVGVVAGTLGWEPLSFLSRAARGGGATENRRGREFLVCTLFAGVHFTSRERCQWASVSKEWSCRCPRSRQDPPLCEDVQRSSLLENFPNDSRARVNLLSHRQIGKKKKDRDFRFPTILLRRSSSLRKQISFNLSCFTTSRIIYIYIYLSWNESARGSRIKDRRVIGWSSIEEKVDDGKERRIWKETRCEISVRERLGGRWNRWTLLVSEEID